MIELPKDVRQQAVASIDRYLREYMDEPIGNIAAAGLLGFFLEEFGPSIHKQAAQRLGAVGPGVGVRAGRQGRTCPGAALTARKGAWRCRL